MRKLVLIIIGLFALFTLIRAYTDVKDAPLSNLTIQASSDFES